MPHARLIDATGDTANGASRARNRGAENARGDFLAFCDADDVVMPGWVNGLARAARYGDIIAGRLDRERLNPLPVQRWLETPSWEPRHPIHNFLPHASTANCGVWIDVFRHLRGFDEEIRAGEDRDFAWRAQLDGSHWHHASDAVVAYRYRTRLADAARQQYRWGSCNVSLFRTFAGAGMPRARVRDAAEAWAWMLSTLPTLPWSPDRRGMWVVRAAYAAGQLAGSVRERVVFL